MAYDPETGMQDGYSYFDFIQPQGMFNQLQVYDPVTRQPRQATDAEYAIWNDFQTRSDAYNADQTSRGFGNQGGQGAASNSQAGMSNWSGPNIQLPFTPEAETPATEPAPSFAPKGVADYSAQNKLESSLKSALKQKTGKNVEYGMRMAPKPSSGGMLSSFK